MDHGENRMRAVRTAQQPDQSSTRHARGFTLFELMITIALLAVIAGFAAPNFMSTLRANRIVTDNNALISALALARSEAIRGGNRVTVCRSADQATCATSGGWEQGWIVFEDPATPGTVNTGETILRVWEALDGGTTIRPAAAFADYVSFLGSGETRGGAGDSGSFRVCGDNADTAEGRTINVGLIGYANTTRGTASCP